MSANNKTKFLFDRHDFSDPGAEDEDNLEEIDLPPPPPTFSEDEMEAARAIAHAAGVSEGELKEKQARDQIISDQLKTIAEQFSALFAAEIYREKQYEEESLKLGLEIIKILSPSLQNHLGLDALKNALHDVLTRQSGQSAMMVEVHPDSTAEIEAHIATIWTDADTAPRYKIVANNTLEKSACALRWDDGGMIRDPQKTALAMQKALEKLLPLKNQAKKPELQDKSARKGNSPLTQPQKNDIKGSEQVDSIDESREE